MARTGGKDRGVVEKPKGSRQWWVRLYINGREKWWRCDNKTQAKALYGRLKAEQREGKLFEKKKPVPFKALADEYERLIDTRRRRPGDDKARLDRWRAALGNQDANTITPRQIERVLEELHCEKKEPATLLRYLTALRAVLNRGKRVGSLDKNVASYVQSPRPNNVLVRYLTDIQERALIEKLPARFEPIVMTAIHTGMRQGELLRLTWQDVDWTVGVLTIHETKSGERRRIPMNSVVQTLLSERKQATRPEPMDRIFQHDHRYLRRAFVKAVIDANLAPFRFHDLRHTFASRLAMRGANDRTLMALGGWKSPRMLDRYAHLSPAHLWQAVEGLVQANDGKAQPQRGITPTTATEAASIIRSVD